MKVSLTDAGKRFNRDWIFRHFNYIFEKGQSYAITGPNGSGKSTLLQVLSGSMMLNEGHIQWSPDNNREVNGQWSMENIYRKMSICAPYLEVIEEMTLKEFLHFHYGFKPFLAGIATEKIISIIDLEKAENKQIRYYSSGMKQRVKLAQAVFSDAPIVLLDEPCTNLDTAGIDLYHRLIEEYCKNRLVVVSSNDEIEYKFCKERINMNDYKG
jgi:ABC-type multidrug transport system ATPase subunit